VDPAIGEHPDARRVPFDAVAQAELVAQVDDVAVGGEPVVVVALEAVAAADVERRRLPPSPGQRS